MSTKHASLDRKLFAWVREHRDNLTVPDAIRILKIQGKSERRHVVRRFQQMRARKFLALVSEQPVQTFQLRGSLPADATQKAWQEALPTYMNRFAGNNIIQPPSTSISASNSDEFLARGGTIEVLTPLRKCPHRGSKPTGDSFSFDDE